MEKSPLELLKEQEELIAYVSGKTKQSLITPENNMSIRLEASQSILESKYQLRAHYTFNGLTGFVESEVNCSDLEKVKFGTTSSDQALEAARFLATELSQKLCERITYLLRQEVVAAGFRDMRELIIK